MTEQITLERYERPYERMNERSKSNQHWSAHMRARTPLESARQAPLECSWRAVTSARVENSVGHKRSLFAVFFIDDVRSWRALISGLRSRALVDRYFRSRAIMSARRSWVLERSFYSSNMWFDDIITHYYAAHTPARVAPFPRSEVGAGVCLA